MNNDLPKHAAQKVRRALDDVHQLTDDPSEMMRIAVLAAGVCIGQAAGFMTGILARDGHFGPREAVIDHLLKLVRTCAVEGAEAAWADISKARSTE